MRRFHTVVAVAVSTAFFVSVCSAQQPSTTSVPNLIRYGGTLKDAQGVALSSSTTVGVTFSIYKQQDGGAAVWMETQNVTPEASGQYSVLLGSTTATGLPSDLFSQEEQRWLGVQVQGQPEQPRVLLVSVPYAFKAHEAETLAGKSISDFVLAKDLSANNSAASVDGSSGSGSTQATAGNSNGKSASQLATLQGPTNFSGTTTDQIVSVVQSGTGKAIVASSSTGTAVVASTSSTTASTNAVSGTIPGAGVAILGHASSTSAQGYGIQGTSDSTIGIGLLGFATATTGSTYGLKGYSSSTAGTGVRGLSTATSGATTGISASVASAAGTAGVFNNTAGGKILSGQNNGAEKFAVDGSGDVNAKGNYVGLGSVSGNQLISTVATGTAPFLVTSSTQVPNLNASTLAGNPPSSFASSSGSPNYIQNSTSMQSSANFNISGKGTLGGSLSAANAVAGGTAVTGNDTATTSTNGSSGIAGFLRNDVNGTAVYGENDVATGGVAIFGYDAATASAATAALYGVSANGFGVLGLANAATGGADGVRGRTNSNGGVGVRGINTADGGTGIFGVARSTSATISAYGISGLTDASGQNSAGVTGFANATTGLVYGVSGSTNSTTQYAAGVSGYEGATTGQVFGVNGSTNSTTDYSVGVSGYEGAASGVVSGVSGGTSSNTNGAAGVSGNAGATTGQVYGVFGSTNSITTSAAGVSGFEGATTGQVYGVGGGTNSTTTNAAGVNGFEGATTGQVFGVSGGTNSSGPGAAGVSGLRERYQRWKLRCNWRNREQRRRRSGWLCQRHDWKHLRRTRLDGQQPGSWSSGLVSRRSRYCWGQSELYRFRVHAYDGNRRPIYDGGGRNSSARHRRRGH